VLAWVSLAVLLLSGVIFCAIGIAEAGALSQAGSNTSNYAWIRGLLQGIQIGLSGLFFWGIFMALVAILENQVRGRS
jgi:hypothetical protein